MDNTPILPASAFLDAQELFLPSQVGIEPLAAVARALRGFDRDQLGSAIEVLIALLDVADGNPDAEPSTWPEDVQARIVTQNAEQLSDDHEDGADAEEAAWIEWERTHPGTRSHCQTGGHEDAEDDDALEDDDADSAVDDEPCDDMFMDMEPDHDAERWEMTHNVPVDPVFTAEHNIFTDARVPLGLSNLLTSYQTGSEGVRSADTGATHRSKPGLVRPEPGVPV